MKQKEKDIFWKIGYASGSIAAILVLVTIILLLFRLIAFIISC